MHEDALTSGYDVIVAGSGTSGMMAAIRAYDLGLSSVVIEKTHFFGGTSAMSGGNMWLPTNHFMDEPDDRESAMTYMKAATRGEVEDDMLEAFLDHGPAMLRYLEEIDVPQVSIRSGPDYLGHLPGSRAGRSTVQVAIDGALLGNELGRMRMPGGMWRILDRYSMDMDDLGILGLRLPGWRRRMACILLHCWGDVSWRLKTRRDRRLTFGNALTAGLRRAMIKRRIPLVYDLAKRLIRDGDRVCGGVFARNGDEIELFAKQAVVLAAGGFEHNTAMRARNLPYPSTPKNSWTPEGNSGDALRAAEAIGAKTDFMNEVYCGPAMQLPIDGTPQTHAYHLTFGNPHSLYVNRAGDRFVDESASYNTVGNAMIADYQRTGKNIPCWMIFDADFRDKYACGGLMPNLIMPDRKLPSNWWDSYIYSAGDIPALARKIELDPARLATAVTRFNTYAASGVDEEFARGSTEFDRLMSGDPPSHLTPVRGPSRKRHFMRCAYMCAMSAPGVGCGSTGTAPCLPPMANIFRAFTRSEPAQPPCLAAPTPVPAPRSGPPMPSPSRLPMASRSASDAIRALRRGRPCDRTAPKLGSRSGGRLDRLRRHKRPAPIAAMAGRGRGEIVRQKPA